MKLMRNESGDSTDDENEELEEEMVFKKRRLDIEFAVEGEKVDEDRSSASDESDGSIEPPNLESLRKSTTADDMKGIIVDEVQKGLDDDKKGLYYAVYYDQRYFWGKLVNVFAEDKDEDVDMVEMTFLQYKMDQIWDYPKKADVGMIPAKYLFLGPVTPSDIIQGKGYKFVEDTNAMARFKEIKKLDL